SYDDDFFDDNDGCSYDNHVDFNFDDSRADNDRGAVGWW
ncbi:MAG: hypothetical protein RIQ63_227, partial [Actinomycetota bacterium]